jgi:hypothetical protein
LQARHECPSEPAPHPDEGLLFGGFLQKADGFLQIANAFLDLSLGLISQALDLLVRAANQLARFFLYLAADVFQGALDLVLVHAHF